MRAKPHGIFFHITPPHRKGTPMDQSRTPHLDRVAGPADMRDFDLSELTALADELRQETIETVSRTGGHLGSSLGVVETDRGLARRFPHPV